jgi:hypothetical protein
LIIYCFAEVQGIKEPQVIARKVGEVLSSAFTAVGTTVTYPVGKTFVFNSSCLSFSLICCKKKVVECIDFAFLVLAMVFNNV